MSLVVHASSAPEQAGAMTGKIMIGVMLLSTLGAIPLVALAPTALRLLNPEYGAMDATEVIAALAAGTVVRYVYVVWAGLQRARRNMGVNAELSLTTRPRHRPQSTAPDGRGVVVVADIPSESALQLTWTLPRMPTSPAELARLM